MPSLRGTPGRGRRRRLRGHRAVGAAGLDPVLPLGRLPVHAFTLRVPPRPDRLGPGLSAHRPGTPASLPGSQRPCLLRGRGLSPQRSFTIERARPSRAPWARACHPAAHLSSVGLSASRTVSAAPPTGGLRTPRKRPKCALLRQDGDQGGRSHRKAAPRVVFRDPINESGSQQGNRRRRLPRQDLGAGGGARELGEGAGRDCSFDSGSSRWLKTG